LPAIDNKKEETAVPKKYVLPPFLIGEARTRKARRALLLAGLGAALLCTPAFAATPTTRLEGVYPVYDKNSLIPFEARLRLGKDGKFSYTMPCFRGDVLGDHQVEGRYDVKDNWLTLEGPAGQVRRDGCTYIKRAYIVHERGEALLIWDLELASATQHRKLPVAWRRGGAPRPYTRKLEEWLPLPYARYLNGGSLSGTVTSVGEQTRERIFGPGEQFYVHAPVEIDLGSEDGVFEGLRVCGPDKRFQFIEQVSAHTSTIDWGGTVSAGTAISLDCER
jgi:hypothetical protein